MPDHPHHDTHGGSVIATVDYNDAFDHSACDPDAACAHYVTDEPADVTLSDLLDAYYGGLYFQAVPPDDVLASFHRIRGAIAHYLALSPEERAEFDRRTT